MAVRIKAKRSIVGIVAKVEFPCGCFALVASGQAAILCSDNARHLPVHVCERWKRHKYELADAERDLADRVHKARRKGQL